MGRRRGLDRTAVVEAAVQLADREGVERFTLAALARRLGVRSPSLYAHTEGLGDLRREVALVGAARMAEALEESVQGAEGLEAIAAICEAYRAFALSHPGLYGAIQAAVGPEEDPERFRGLGRMVTPVYRALAEAGVPGEARVHVARGLRAALHGFVILEALRGFGLPVEVDESFRRMVRLLIAGVERAAAAH